MTFAGWGSAAFQQKLASVRDVVPNGCQLRDCALRIRQRSLGRTFELSLELSHLFLVEQI